MRSERKLIRIFLVVVLIGSYALAVTYQGSLASLLIYAYGPISQFFPAVLATLCWRRATGAGVLSGLLAGSFVSLAFVTFLMSTPAACTQASTGCWPTSSHWWRCPSPPSVPTRRANASSPSQAGSAPDTAPVLVPRGRSWVSRVSCG